ncbi:protein SEY1 [Penicillium macrosclerotiorum]|uniref:protein SEY1 n=1 Tax=Penicillium macrosclerotiorum TaxID=303699 RepID=UPI002548548A|nr:protein SEY1 [Penicillium macrosclerotiorum]KAJ5675385.1 protein SEY1 [Penicillium macrosclerotiorum]
MQSRDNIRKPARYESGVWSQSEAEYDAGKRECRAVLKALKKFRHCKKHSAADGLSRRPATEQELIDQAKEADIDEFIAEEVSYLRVPVWVLPEGRILSESYSDDSEMITRYLSSLRRPEAMPRSQFYTFKKKALQFAVQGEYLFYRGRGVNLPLRRVLDTEEDRQRVLKGAHDEIGHREREATYHLLKLRYWWEGMYTNTAEFVRSYIPC